MNMWLIGLSLGLAGLLMAAGAVITVHLVVSAANSFRSAGSVWAPREVLNQVVAALGVRDGDRLVDLGCGDGRVLAAVLEQTPGVRALGVDNNPVTLMRARWRLGRRARLAGGDLRRVKLGGYDRVFVYLGARLMADLAPRFERELGSGARVVSLQFELPGRRPTRVVELENGRPYAKRLYVYDY